MPWTCWKEPLGCSWTISADDDSVVAGDLTKEDAAKRHRQRRKASKQMKDEDLQSLHRTPGVVAWKT